MKADMLHYRQRDSLSDRSTPESRWRDGKKGREEREKRRHVMWVALLGAGALLGACASPQVASSRAGSASAAPTASSSPTAALTPAPSASARPSPTLTAVLDDRFGFVFWEGVSGRVSHAVHRESDPRPTHDDLEEPGRVMIGDRGLAVSPDGRRLAYWTRTIGPPDGLPHGLRVLDIAPGARPRTLLTLPQNGKEFGDGVAWSSDGTGLVIGVHSDAYPAADAPPYYSAIRLLDPAGGQPREIARIRGVLLPLAWDRKERLVAAYETCGGSLCAYDLIEESGTLVARTPMNIGCARVEASPDAKQLLAHGRCDDVLRVWPLASPERAVDLRPTGGERVRADARWRPGTAEIGVLFDDRLELWEVSGARRVIPLPPLPFALGDRPFFFRADGSAAFISAYGPRALDGRYSPSYLAVALATGRSVVIPGEDVLSASVRLDP